jgi:NADPH2:quinone reductase
VSSLPILGLSVGSYVPAHAELVRPGAEGAPKAISAGLVNLHTEIIPLEQAPEAHHQIEAGQVNGRILLAP